MNYMDLIGAPWSEQFNCWDLCREMFRRSGRDLPLYSEYIGDLVERRAFIDLNIENDFTKAAEPEAGCLVVFRLLGELHMGYMLDRFNFIHCQRKKSVVVEPLKRWEKMISGYWRYTGR